MTPYTPTPVQLPSTIQIPQDVLDDVKVETVNSPIADVANGVAYLEAVNGTYWRGNFTEGTFTNERLPLTQSGSGYQGITLGSDESLTIEEDGVYLVSFQLAVSLASVPALNSYSVALIYIGPSQTASESWAWVTNTNPFLLQATAVFSASGGSRFEFYPLAPYASIPLTVLQRDRGNTVSIVRIK